MVIKTKVYSFYKASLDPKNSKTACRVVLLLIREEERRNGTRK